MWQWTMWTEWTLKGEKQIPDLATSNANTKYKTICINFIPFILYLVQTLILFTNLIKVLNNWTIGLLVNKNDLFS